jgi:7-cyano-7-deazaguanine synthase in queuosine biosynthesis
VRRQPRQSLKERGAPATAVHVRNIVMLFFAFVILHGEKVAFHS